VAEVRGEAGQRILDRLLVAEVDEETAHERQARILARRHVPTALREQGEDADRLHRDRLAPGVRPRDQEDARGRRQLEIQRHDRAHSERLLEQGMPATADPQAAVRRELRPSRPTRLAPAHRGADAIDEQEQVGRLLQRRRGVVHALVQIEQDARLLRAHLEPRLGEVVRELHGLGRFDVDGLAGVAAVVDDAGQLAPVGGVQRQAETVAPHGDLRGGGPAVAARLGHRPGHRLPHLLFAFAHRPPQARQERARRVHEVAVAVQAAAQLAGESGEAPRLRGRLAPGRHRRPGGEEPLPELVEVLREAGHRDQVRTLQATRRRPLQLVQRGRQIGDRRPLAGAGERPQLVGERVRERDRVGVGVGQLRRDRRRRAAIAAVASHLGGHAVPVQQVAIAGRRDRILAGRPVGRREPREQGDHDAPASSITRSPISTTRCHSSSTWAPKTWRAPWYTAGAAW